MTQTRQPAMSLEQFLLFSKSLPETANVKQVARSLGVVLPYEQVSLETQLASASVVQHTLKTKDQSVRSYAVIPSLQLGEKETTREIWVNAQCVRAVANRLLELADQNGL